jgi:16S rRNA (uracil1498-N3)-methyltransferase
VAAPRFHVDADLQHGSSGELRSDQSQQVQKVLRLTVGAELTLFNGSGVEASARIVELRRPGTRYQVDSVVWPDREPPTHLTVGLALLRGERFEYAIQKLTEIGVARIVPLRAERCVVSFDDFGAWERRRERYERIAREAAEQCERVTLPDIEAPTSLAEFLSTRSAIVLVERSAAPSLADYLSGAEVAVAIGPEGGWSDRERDEIEDLAAETASLGKLILRAETAAIVAAGTIIQRSWRPVEQRGEQETT